jgi:hypothetical protein
VPLAVYPLTPLQEGMFFQCLASPHSGVDVEQVIVRLEESLDAPAFRQAWQFLVDRHEALRLRFLINPSGQARQYPLPEVAFTITEHDWSGASEAEQQQRLESWLTADRKRGFDPRVELPMRVTRIRLGPARDSFIWTWWHGIMDGRTRLTLMRELFAAYAAFQQGHEPSLPPTRWYLCYTRWLATRDSSADAAHWRTLLADISEPTAISEPATRAQPESQGWDFGKHEQRLTPELTDQLRAFCRAQNVTMNTLLQGAWALVLGEFSGQDDVLFGSTRACRYSAFEQSNAAEDIIGSMINTVPVRVGLRAGVRVGDWLRELRAQHVAARPYELTPLSVIQAASGVRSDRRLFDSLVVYENQILDSALRAAGGAWAGRRFEIRGCTGLPLTVFAYGEPGLLLGIANDRARVSDARAGQMLKHLVQAMQSLAENPAAPVTQITLLPETERRLLLEEWNHTESDFPAEHTLSFAFEEQVARTPDAPALTFAGQTWTISRTRRTGRTHRPASARRRSPTGDTHWCLPRALPSIGGRAAGGVEGWRRLPAA